MRRGQEARISDKYEVVPETKGALITIRRVLEDGCVAVLVKNGVQAGSVLIIKPEFIELFS